MSVVSETVVERGEGFMAKAKRATEPFRSEHLRATRILYEPTVDVPALPPPLLMVTDSNTVLRSIVKRAQMTAPNARTILQELADSGFVTFIVRVLSLRDGDRGDPEHAR